MHEIKLTTAQLALLVNICDTLQTIAGDVAQAYHGRNQRRLLKLFLEGVAELRAELAAHLPADEIEQLKPPWEG